MGINLKLLPLKVHFFLFMGGTGAILPYLVVFGKQLGISTVLMGTINGIQPLFYILIKPLAGVLMDYFHKRRSLIFSSSILLMAIFFSLTYVSLPSSKQTTTGHNSSTEIIQPNSINVGNSRENPTKSVINQDGSLNENRLNKLSENETNLKHHDDGYPINQPSSTAIWTFLGFMVLGIIMYNICNSYSDTVCFDMLGDGKDKEYGKQRVWGGIGYGICACISGLLMDVFSDDSGYKNNTPAFVILAVLTSLNVLVSLKLKPSSRPSSPTIFKDVFKVLKNLHVAWFLLMTLVLGMCDSFTMYFLLWYLEDISIATGQFSKIRTIQGTILLAETLLGETISFHYSGYIIDKIGYNASFIFCLLLYAARFGILAIIPSVWWALPSESILQASFSLGYTLVVSYTNYISTSGIQATMQSISMAVFDGFGFALGSILVGLSLQYIGGRFTLALLALLCLVTAVLSSIVFTCLNWRAKCKKISEPAVAS